MTSVSELGEAPGAWLQEFLDVEDQLLGLLDEISQQTVRSEHALVREEIRNFSESFPEAFQIITYSLYRNEKFFADIETQVNEIEEGRGTQIRTRLETYGNEYGPILSEEFRLILDESMDDRRNSITATSTESELLVDDSLPRINYRAYSGNLEILNMRGGPDHLIDFAESTLSAVDHTFRRLNERGEEIVGEDISAVRQSLTELKHRQEAINEKLESLEPQDSSE